MTLPKSTYTREVRSSTVAYRPNARTTAKNSGAMMNIRKNVTAAPERKGDAASGRVGKWVNMA